MKSKPSPLFVPSCSLVFSRPQSSRRAETYIGNNQIDAIRRPADEKIPGGNLILSHVQPKEGNDHLQAARPDLCVGREGVSDPADDEVQWLQGSVLCCGDLDEAGGLVGPPASCVNVLGVSIRGEIEKRRSLYARSLARCYRRRCEQDARCRQCPRSSSEWWPRCT